MIVHRKAKTTRPKAPVPVPKVTPPVAVVDPLVINKVIAVVVHNGVMSCPECAAGKCRNCTGATWDDVADDEAPCPCAILTGHGAQR